MEPHDDQSVTQRQAAEDPTDPDKRPVLIVVGRADRNGSPDVVQPVNLPSTLTIGRGRAGDSGAPERLTFDDPLLSRVHFRIERRPGGCTLEDAGSLNGTLVEGHRVKDPVRLPDGALIFFGAQAAILRRVSANDQRALEEERRLPLGPIATAAPVLAARLERLRRLARADTEVLLVGETGVGKEVYARALHHQSSRCRGPFVAINCAAIPGELAESELFGYARGAHSTATAAKPGLLESAAGGTVLLDEIGDMSPALQAKLLRFLQDRTVTPLGGVAPRAVDVRVVAATTGAGQQLLRSDLIGRFGAEVMVIPPLRERMEDLGRLLAHFARDRIAGFEPGAFRALCLHGWPRNVRELAKAVDHIAALCEGGRARLEHLPEGVRSSVQVPKPPASHRPAPSRGELEALLRAQNGNVAEVARMLGRQWNVVRRWITRYGIAVDRWRS